MKKIFSKKSLIIGVLFFFLIFYFYDRINNKVVRVGLSGYEFEAEVAWTNADLQKGLGGRGDMCKDCAMLFQFPKSGKYSFWMKGMQFPLDIMWISDGKIVHMEKNIKPTFTGVLSYDAEADQVLEINAGLSDELGLKVGDEVKMN